MKNFRPMKIKVILLVCMFAATFVNAQKKIDRGHWRETKEGMHYKKAEPGTKEQLFEDWSKEVEEGENGEKRRSNAGKIKERQFLRDAPGSSGKKRRGGS